MSAERIALAIDGGGTKTLACLVCGPEEASCRVIAESIAGPSNPAAVGIATTKANLRNAVESAIQTAEIVASRIQIAVVGLAGLEATSFKTDLEQWMTNEFGIGHVQFMTDVQLLLYAGQRTLPAIVLISGTGSTAFGRSGKVIARTGGRGYLLGDEGSGFWIGQRGMIAAIRAMDHAAPPTQLVELIGAKLDAASADEWTMRVYAARDPRDLIAQMSREVNTAAELGDTVAIEILESAATELAFMVTSVAKQLDSGRNRV